MTYKWHRKAIENPHSRQATDHATNASASEKYSCWENFCCSFHSWVCKKSLISLRGWWNQILAPYCLSLNFCLLSLLAYRNSKRSHRLRQKSIFSYQFLVPFDFHYDTQNNYRDTVFCLLRTKKRFNADFLYLDLRIMIFNTLYHISIAYIYTVKVALSGRPRFKWLFNTGGRQREQAVGTHLKVTTTA